MKPLKSYIGVALIIVGALLFLLHHFDVMSGNLTLLTGLLCIISGIITHIIVQKHGGKY